MKIIDRTAKHFVRRNEQEAYNIFELLLSDLSDIQNRIDEYMDEHMVRAIDNSCLVIKELCANYVVLDDARYYATVCNVRDLITALGACINIAEKMTNQ